jgi:hypothetical protein
MKSILTATFLLLALATVGRAQTTPPPAGTWGPDVGSHEFTLGGSGAVNNDFNNSFGGVNFSLGMYTTPMIE